MTLGNFLNNLPQRLRVRAMAMAKPVVVARSLAVGLRLFERMLEAPSRTAPNGHRQMAATAELLAASEGSMLLR